MIYLACFVIAFAVLQFIVAIVNLIFNKQLMHGAEPKELLSVLIPARNEENNIPLIIKDLQAQSFQNIEIIIFDDQSDDNTANIVNQLAQQDKKIKLITSDGLPEGWLGKNYACHTLSKHAKGDYLLFLDADVRVNGRILADAIGYSAKHKLGLLSIFPYQQMRSRGEEMTVPIMNFILLTLLPLVLVRASKFESLSAANGQFMLFRKETYLRLLPHKKLSMSKVEDIEIARYLKHQGEPVACLIGNKEIQCRMYTGFNEATDGFSKNIFMFFGNSILLTVLFFAITTLGWIPVAIACSNSVTIAYVALIVLTRVIVSAVSLQSILKNILFILSQQISLGIIIHKAIFKTVKKQHEWKGRSII